MSRIGRPIFAILDAVQNGLRSRSFSEKIRVGFGLTTGLMLLISLVSIYALRSVTLSKNQVAFDHSRDLMTAEKLRTVIHQKVAIYRGFLLTRERLYLVDAASLQDDYKSLFETLRKKAAGSAGEMELIHRIELREQEHEFLLGQTIALRKRKASMTQISRVFDLKVMPAFDQVERALNSYIRYKENQLEMARVNSTSAASRAMTLILLISFLSLALAGSLAWILSRTLTKLFQEKESALQSREEVMAVVSHDLRNPLTSILMNASLINRLSAKVALSDPECADSVMKTASSIGSAAQRMDRLVQDLLDAVKLKSGSFHIEKHGDQVPALVDEVLRAHETLAAQKGIRLSKVVDSELGDVFWDRGRILQVFSNLLGNSIKFSPSDSQLTIRAEASLDSVIFEVKDQGPGIPEEQLPKVFERFWQAKETAAQGTGLGLAICKAIVEAHGGSMWVKSQVGLGTSFYFKVPRTNDALPVKPGLRTSPVAALMGTSLRSRFFK